jgi:cyclopropane-fatty-acyl-phospholipid synthase
MTLQMNPPTAARPSMPGPLPTAAHAALKLLERMRHGTLTVQLPDGTHRRFGAGEPQATIRLRNWNVFGATLRSGDIGFAESYVEGDWSTPSLTALMAVLLANRGAVEELVYGSWFGRMAHRLRHLLNRNSKGGSRKNIHAHYDLGNAFYSLWLDETMNYSAAWFDGRDGQPMAQAQDAKVRRALRMAGVQPGSRLLEIGCGWGALAECAAREFGAQVSGVTLSTEQLAFARDRLAQAGVQDRADLRLQDYRDIADGPFDAVCSIEMVEAVGREYWPQYFGALDKLLRPGGRACVQSIVIDDALWDRYIRGTDFIQQYIFPGGCLPCPREFKRAAEAAGLVVVDAFHFGADYAQTLQRWRERFLAQKAQVRELGFDERFIRLWEFYLAYCEAAFTAGNIDVVQYTLQKP